MTGYDKALQDLTTTQTKMQQVDNLYRQVKALKSICVNYVRRFIFIPELIFDLAR